MKIKLYSKMNASVNTSAASVFFLECNSNIRNCSQLTQVEVRSQFQIFLFSVWNEEGLSKRSWPWNYYSFAHDSFSSSLTWVYPPERYSKDHADLSSLFYFSFTGDAVNLVYIGFLPELLPQDQLTLDCRTFCPNSKARRIIHLTG